MRGAKAEVGRGFGGLRAGIALAGALVVLLAVPGLAFASDESAVSPLSAAPVLGGASETLAPGGAQLAAEAHTSSSEAVVAREASQTQYEGLSPTAAEGVFNEAFPSLVDHAAGGLPSLPAGARYGQILNAHGIAITLADGEPSVVESSMPIASKGPSENFAPLELGLSEGGGGYAPKRAIVPVSVPKDLEEGVSLPQMGVSLTPLASNGSSAGANTAMVDGDAVFWGGAAMGTDVDALARATPQGFDLLAILRSERSPTQLRYRIGTPEGATVRQPEAGGPIEVLDAGQEIAEIAAPAATDAEGTAAALRLSLSGDVLSVSLAEPLSRYKLPLTIDPEVSSVTESYAEGNWHEPEHPGPGYSFKATSSYLEITHTGSYEENDDGYYYMHTNGDSKIYEFSAWLSPSLDPGAPLGAWTEIEDEGETENEKSPRVWSTGTSTVCAVSSCEAAAGAQGNSARAEVSTLGAVREAESFKLWVSEEKTYISEPKGSHASVAYQYSPSEIDHTNNVLYSGSWADRWMSEHQGAFEFTSSDSGLGVAGTAVETKAAPAGEWFSVHTRNFLTEESACIGVQCAAAQKEQITYAMAPWAWAQGEDTVRVSAHDAIEGTTEAREATVMVDTKAPEQIVASGLKQEGSAFVLGELEGHLKAEATDAGGAKVTSGVKDLELYVDGKELGKADGSCEPGPCTAKAEWAISGSELGAGTHTVTIKATDYAGNSATKTYTLDVYPAAPVALGPGSVNPESGDFALEASDVQMSGGMGDLAVTRHYDSLNPAEGAGGPLGGQWTLSLGSLAQLEELPDGSVMVEGPEGLAHFAKKANGELEAPPGDGDLTLVAKSTEVEFDGEKFSLPNAEYLMEDKANGTTTRFTYQIGTKMWMPTVSEGRVATDTVTDTYEPVTIAGKAAVEPLLEVAPHPKASCEAPKKPNEQAKLERGCRALEFNYAESTTATGESPSQWGDYQGHLTRVYFVAWDPVSKKMKSVVVAHYLYDSQGRLRAEWDPRVEGELKTVYGYDSEGHVTAVSAPGQEPWLIHYGSSEQDPRAGRVLSVSRPKADVSLESVSLGAPSNTEAPAISSQHPREGQSVSVSAGKWADDALAYGYQWEDCEYGEKPSKCAAIPGAVNSSYTVRPSDELKDLRVLVTATNADGSTSASSAAVTVPDTFYAPTYAASFSGSGSECELSKPAYIAVVGASGQEELAVTSSGNERVAEFKPGGECVRAFNSHGSEPTGIAASEGAGCDLWVADSGGKKVNCFLDHDQYYQGTESHATSPLGGMAESTNSGGYEYLDLANSAATGIASYAGDPVEYKKSYGSEGSGAGEMKQPSDLKMGASLAGGENIDVADTGNDRVDAFAKGLLGGEVGESIGSVGEAGTGNGQLSSPRGVAVEPYGLIWVSDTGNHRVQVFAPPKQESFGTYLYGVSQGQYVGQFGVKGTGSGQFEEPLGIVRTGELGQEGEGAIYVADRAENKIEKWLPGKPPAEPALPPAEATSEPNNLTTTVEYYVPLSGAGVTNQLGEKEVEAWGQKDDPVYAMAILPPRKVAGWPAKSYEGASTYYLDSHGRTVNVASPSGGISTTEYNEYNQVVRSLGADDRATAVKEGTKSVEASKRLDTESVYESYGGLLLETKGPEHLVKLASGEEKQARNKIHYYYGEGAPEGEEDAGLVTKTTDGAEAGGKEYEVRESTTSYSGQNDLGWSLGRPTSATTDPKGLKLTHTTVYEPGTGNVIETRSPGAGGPGQETSTLLHAFGEPVPASQLVADPKGVAIDSKGDVWIADTEVDRVVELSSSGEYITSFGSPGSGQGQFQRPEGVAIDSKGDVWVADTGNSRIEELSSTGKYLGQIKEFGTLTPEFKLCAEKDSLEECERLYPHYQTGTGKGAFKEPAGVSFDSKGDLFVADTGNDRAQEGQVSGQFSEQFEGHVEAPTAVAANSSGDVWVAGKGSHDLSEFSSTGSYLTSSSSASLAFSSINGLGIDSKGDIWVSGVYANSSLAVTMVEFSANGEGVESYATEGSGSGKLEDPGGLALTSSGDLWVADTAANSIQEISTAYAYVRQFPSSAPEQLMLYKPSGVAASGSQDVWVADSGHDRIQEATAEGSFLRSVGSRGTGNAQFKEPQGITVDSAGHLWVADTGNDRVQELSSEGAYMSQFGSKGSTEGKFEEPVAIANHSEDLYVLDHAEDRVQEFTTAGSFVRQFGSKGTGEGQLQGPEGITVDKEGHVWVADTGNDRVVEFSSTGTFMHQFGAAGSGKGEFLAPTAVQVEEDGNVWVADTGNDRVQQLTSTGTFLQQLGKSQVNEPASLALQGSSGHLLVLDRGSDQVATWQPGSANHEALGQGGPHSSITVYYSAEANSKYPACGEHIEWVNLPCETLPGKQPETPGLPPLPVTRIEYNVYDQPEKTIETFGSVVRTQTTTYDEAGRPISASESVSGSSDKAVPAVSEKYSAETGALVEQSSESEGKKQSVTSTYNKLGQLESYTDAQGNTTEYSYDEYGRMSKVSYDAKGLTPGPAGAYETYKYNEATGALNEIKDSAAGSFRASYDAEGNITTRTFPNGMSANYAYNSIGEAVSLSYEKTSDCSEKCVWFSDSAMPSIHGEWLSQQSSLASYGYAYDADGRLTEVKETPTGQGCVVRAYAYDAESDRDSLTTRQPGAEGKCASEGGETQSHSYDEADRMTDSGITYEGLGDITKLPAGDAGGTAIESSYYVDGQLASQTRGQQSNEYLLDPEDRTSETVSTGLEAKRMVAHYAGTGGSPSWSLDKTTGSWSRQILAFGGLVAVQEDGEQPNLQLADLQGNIVATAALAESATKLLTEERSTEFGVPVSGKPAQKYGWLGAAGLSSELAGGAVVQDGSTYVPQIGRPLQTISTAPPLPGNNATAFVSTTLSWVAASAAASAATETLIYQEEQRKRQEAEAPVGKVPYPGDETWPDPEKGTNTHGCKIKAYWEDNLVGAIRHSLGGEYLEIGGEFECRDEVWGFEIQIELQRIVSGKSVKGGVYETVDKMYKAFFSHARSGKTAEAFECIDGEYYRIWMFARYWYSGGYTPWSATTGDGNAQQCEIDEPPEREPPLPYEKPVNEE